MSTENVESWKRYRKLPLKIWYHPMDLSAQTERMLDEAMVATGRRPTGFGDPCRAEEIFGR
jgi:hypothetical protein